MDTAKDEAMRTYASMHDDHAILAQTGDYAAHGAAVILLRAYTGEMNDPEPGEPSSCPCPQCFRYLVRDWAR